MENLVNSFNGAFKGKCVLVTGHTGFKGSWLSIWLNLLGAKVIGYSLDPPTSPNNFELTGLNNKIIDIRGDVRDIDNLNEVIKSYNPEIIFHLAAQPIVLKSFEDPKETFETNTFGTLNVLEAVRRTNSVKALICITSDKCYRNQEMIWGYKENDHLGGNDPYSASKAMAELLITSYQKSFFLTRKSGGNGVCLSSVRAGNVIGGGDFAEFRLVPDTMKSLISNKPVIVRNPTSVRPWQHVLVPLSGYLWLAAKLISGNDEFVGAWNFGPPEIKGVTTQSVVEKLIKYWGSGSWGSLENKEAKKEDSLLKLNCEKAAHHLSWFPAYNCDESLKATVDWFRKFKELSATNLESTEEMYSLCASQILEFTKKAQSQNIAWAS